MSRKKLSSAVKNLILREKKRAPYLGVRELAKILSDKHKISISKSSIHNLLKSKGVREKPGRKKASLSCRAKVVEPCGLMLLRALDSQIGLFDCLTEGLKPYLPDLNRSRLKRLVILASFSFFADKKLSSDLRRTGFLRVVGLSQLSWRRVNYFNRIIAEKHPLVSLTKLKEDLRPVRAVKFYFKDGSRGFSDGRLATFWDKPPKLEDFSLCLKVIRQRIKQMFDEKLLIIGYTRSFNYLSPAAFNFAQGLRSGLNKIELLGSQAELLETIKPSFPELSFVFGYSPQILTPPAFPGIRSRKFKPFFHPELGEFYLLNSPAVFSASQAEELRLDNIQIKKGRISVSWGLLGSLINANKKSNLANILTQYLYLWPYILDDFFKEVAASERRASLGLKRKNIAAMLPGRLMFAQPIDFIRVGQILSVLFKELVGGWEPKSKIGTFSLRKGYLKIVLKQAPLKLKKAFNNSGFFIDQRRVFLG